MDLEAEQHHADPHPKKSLREAAWKEVNETSQRVRTQWADRYTCKLKTNEWAKPGKYPRVIMDLTCPASLQGFRTSAFLKKAMAAEPLELHGGLIEFCSTPEPEALKAVFEKLLAPPGRFYFVYFSDDSCFSIRHNGRVHIFNVDISSCDASHGEQLFKALEEVTPSVAHADIADVVAQCRMPFSIRSQSFPKRKIKLVPKHTTLYSGVTVTTVANNLGNIFIAIALSEFEFGEDVSMGVTQAAQRAGYIVTCETCSQPEDIQFLKHSPALTTDLYYYPLLNLGVLFRLSGVCKGDLPGRGDIALRARDFQASLVQGAYPRSHFPLVDQLRGPGTPCHDIPDLKFKVVDAGRIVHFTSDAVYKRYRLTPLQIIETDFFGSLGFRDVYTCTGIDAILQLDYGLSALTHTRHQPRGYR